MPEDLGLQSLKYKKNKAVVYRITIAQFAVTLFITLVLLALVDFKAAYSALLAGLISTFTTIYMGRKFFFGAAGSTRERLASIYMAELIKILFITVAFFASVLVFDVQFLAFVCTYIATLFVYLLAMVWPIFGVQIKTITKQ